MVGNRESRLGRKDGRMNEQKPPGGIEWTRVWSRRGYTSNPVKGCPHECRWLMPDGSIAKCYAKSTAEGVARGAYPYGFEHVSFHPEELEAITRHRAPAGIFIDSMSDLFSQQVKPEWIAAVLATIRDNPRHIFFSLTKNAPRLIDFSPFPNNLWVGISSPPTFMFGRELTDDQQRTWYKRALEILDGCEASVRWTSIEPASIDLSEILASNAWLDWAVVGAASNGSRTFQPDRLVLANILRALKCPVFFKGNLDPKTVEQWREEFPPEHS
jgi:protein gp37